MNKHWIGKWVESIEDGQLGMVMEADNKGFVRVVFANMLSMAILGYSAEAVLDQDDWDWRDVKDLELVKGKWCEVCEGDGRVPTLNKFSAGTGTRSQRNYEANVNVECLECNGCGIVEVARG